SAMGAFPVEAVTMLARIAAEVEPTHRQLTVKEMYADVDLTGKILPMHLLLVSVEASLQYLKPAAVVTCTETGNFARQLAAFRFLVLVVAISDDRKIAQGLVFSRGVVSLYQPNPPGSWSNYVREWIRREALPGNFALLTHRGSSTDDRNYRLEILDL